jgi:hypothetical protein
MRLESGCLSLMAIFTRFRSRNTRELLTGSIVARWLNAFETLTGKPGQFHPVRNEPISSRQLVALTGLIREKLKLLPAKHETDLSSEIPRAKSFSLFVRLFPELQAHQPVAIPMRDMSEDDFCYEDTTLLRSLDIIGTVYRTRDVDPNRPLTFFETAKILTRIYHVLAGVTVDCQVFLAHSSKDKEIVRDVRSALEARGIKCFIDEVDLHLSDDIQEVLANRIVADNTVVVAFLSANSINAPWVKFELRVASHKALTDTQKLLLVRLDDIEIPPKLLGLRYSDFLYCRSSREYERMCDLEKNIEEIYFTLLAIRSSHTEAGLA